jgi:hypothetical protein
MGGSVVNDSVNEEALIPPRLGLNCSSPVGLPYSNVRQGLSDLRCNDLLLLNNNWLLSNCWKDDLFGRFDFRSFNFLLLNLGWLRFLLINLRWLYLRRVWLLLFYFCRNNRLRWLWLLFFDFWRLRFLLFRLFRWSIRDIMMINCNCACLFGLIEELEC